MFLVDYQIKSLCEAGLISDYDPDLVNPASLDVRIGNNAIFEKRDDFGNWHWVKYDLSQHTVENPVLIAPNKFFLTETLEVFNFPDTVVGMFFLKSSRAREGWEHSHAGFIDPKFHNSVLTLELKNNCQGAYLPLYKGLKMGQILLGQCNTPVANYAQTGKYNNCLTVVGSKG